MKKILQALCLSATLSAVILPSLVQAQPMSLSSTQYASKKISGTWYDGSGNTILTITPNYINGCPIIEGDDFAGGYPGLGTFIIQEAQGRKAIKLAWIGFEKHKMLIMNDSTILYGTHKGNYQESVHGIYIGMTEKDLYEAHGPASRESKTYGRRTLIYDGLHLSVDIEYGIIVQIHLYPGAYFDHSGLTVDSSIIDYYNTYQFNRMPSAYRGSYSGAYSIGSGEYIFFDQYPNSVTLSIYNN